MKKKSTDYFAKGIMISLLLILIDLIGGFAHLRFEGWFKWIGTIVLVFAIIIFCVQFAKQQTNGVTFGKVFGYGFKIALVISILLALYTLLSFFVIFPELPDQILANSRSTMEAQGKLTQDQIDQGLAISKKFLQPVPLMIFAFLGTLFFGTIASLLGGALAKKSEPVPTVLNDNP
jgi:hypothetical protein